MARTAAQPPAHYNAAPLACTMGTRPVSRQSTESSTQWVTQKARSRISITCSNGAGGAERSGMWARGFTEHACTRVGMDIQHVCKTGKLTTLSGRGGRTSGKVGGALRSSTLFCVPRDRASSSPAGGG